jgi:hypothetical protein
MKSGIMQPYFLPYIGYFQLMKMVDTYVIADDVNFIKGGWANRNKMLLQGKEFLFNLVTLKASSNKLFKDLYVDKNQTKLLRTIELSYKNSPQFPKVFPLIEKIIHYEDKNFARYVGNSLIQIAKYLDFGTKILYASDIESDRTLAPQPRIISDCKLLGAKTYVNAIGGIKLYDKEKFKEAGIELCFLKPRSIEYQQFSKKYFVPCLSMLDVMMFNSAEQTNTLLSQYDLV